METRETEQRRWSGPLWILLLIALVLTIAVLLVLLPRPFAYITPAPTDAPWTAAPGLYTIPTVAVPTPSVPPPAISFSP